MINQVHDKYINIGKLHLYACIEDLKQKHVFNPCKYSMFTKQSIIFHIKYTNMTDQDTKLHLHEHKQLFNNIFSFVILHFLEIPRAESRSTLVLRSFSREPPGGELWPCL